MTVILTVLLTASASATPAPDSEVTIYSNGNMFTVSMPHADHAMFMGWIYDGDQRIGFVQPKHFLTLRLPAGRHTFSASLSTKHPARNSQLPLDLVAGRKYFIRVQEESRGVLVVSSDKGRLDLVTCEIAHQDAVNGPTDLKHIMPAWRDKITSAKSIPPCD